MSNATNEKWMYANDALFMLWGGKCAGGRHEGSRVRLPREENARGHRQCLFGENVRKTETCGLRTLSVKGSGVVFTHRECISTPHIRHKGQQPLIKCAIMTSKLCIFLFYVFFPFICVFLCFFYFCVFFMFFTFLLSTRVFPSLLYILECDEEIRPT